MPYTHQWLNPEHTIIQWEIKGDINWSDYHSSINAVCEEIDSAQQNVYLIIIDTVGTPVGNALPHIKKSLLKYHECQNLDGIVVVANHQISLFIGSLMNVTETITGLHVSVDFVESLDEAYKTIEKYRLSSK